MYQDQNTVEGSGSSGPPPTPSSTSPLVRRLLSGLRSDVLSLETFASKLAEFSGQVTDKIARTRSELVSLETLLAQAPMSVLEDLQDIRGGDRRVDF